MYWLMNFNSLPEHQLWLDPDVKQRQRISCTLVPDHIRTTRNWELAAFADPAPPDKPSRNADALYCANTATFVMSHRLLTAMQHEGLTGWTAFDAPIKRRGGERATTHAELRVTGFGGVADRSSGCVLLSRCPECGLNTYAEGFRFDVAVAQLRSVGLDFLTIWPLSRRILCSDRARKLMMSFDVQEIDFQDPKTLDQPMGSIGDTPIPPFFDARAKAEIEAFWSTAPLEPRPQ
jgi:hypothetical protein